MSFKNWVFLLCLYLIYLTFGMWLFHTMECGHEMELQEAEMAKAIAAHQDLEIIRAALDSRYEKMLDKLFVTLHSDLYPFYEVVSGINAYSSNVSFPNSTSLQFCQKWSWYNSFFFSLTAVTTIGYGHISPETTDGRLWCIFYCLVGVPLNALLIGTLGNFFSIKAIKLKKKFSEYQNDMKWRELESLHVVSRIVLEGTCWVALGVLLFMVIPATIFYFVEGKIDYDKHGTWHNRWEYIDSLYYTFITLSTIGFGDMVAARQMSKEAVNAYEDFGLDTWKLFFYNFFIIVWILLGMGYIFMIVNVIAQAIQSTGKPMKKAIKSMKNQIHVSEYWKNIMTELMEIKNAHDRGSSGSLLVRVESDPCLRDTPIIGPRKVKSSGDLQGQDGSRPDGTAEENPCYKEDSHYLHIPETIQELNEDTIRSLREFLASSRLGGGPGGRNTSAASSRPVSRQSSVQRNNKVVSRTNSNTSNRSANTQGGAIGHLLEQTTLAQFLEAAENVRKRSMRNLSDNHYEENTNPSLDCREEDQSVRQVPSMAVLFKDENEAKNGSIMQESSRAEMSSASLSQPWTPLKRFERQLPAENSGSVIMESPQTNNVQDNAGDIKQADKIVQHGNESDVKFK